MNCPKCGAPTKPGAGFCPNCGASLAAAMPMAPSLSAKKKPNMLLIVAVIAVVAIVLIAAAAALSGGSTKATDNNNTNTNTDNTASNSQLAMSVSNIQAYHPTTLYAQADAGNILVYVYGNITNKGAMSMYVSPLSFYLIGSDGVSYTYTWLLDSFTSAYLDHDKSMAFYCGFEIPAGVTPKTIKYDDKTDSISVSVTSAIMDLNYPQYVDITDATFATVTSDNPYITPDAGNEFVQVTMTFKSKMPSSLTMNPFYFTLETSDGQTHDVTYSIDPVVPDGLQPGASATIKLTYEISESAHPTKLMYDDFINRVTVEFIPA